MFAQLAWLLMWGAAARDAGFSSLQTNMPASKSRLFEGDRLNREQVLRSVHLKKIKERATRVRQAMEEKEKSLLAQVPEEKDRSLLAQVHASDQNRTEKMANYSKILEENVTDLEACHKCGEAEKELIDAVDAALEMHEDAESAAEVHSELAETHALAVEAFDKANQEYTQAVSQICPIELASDAEESAFDSVVAAAEHLKEKAMVAQEKKASENANKTLVDQAKSQYDDAAAAAEEADQPIAAKIAAEEVACANVLPKKARDAVPEEEELGPPPLPTPEPTSHLIWIYEPTRRLNWNYGDGKGSKDQRMPGTYSTPEKCAKAVAMFAKEENNPVINGATYGRSGSVRGKCYAEYGMTGVKSSRQPYITAKLIIFAAADGMD